jgi:hypothetical protein
MIYIGCCGKARAPLFFFNWTRLNSPYSLAWTLLSGRAVIFVADCCHAINAKAVMVERVRII